MTFLLHSVAPQLQPWIFNDLANLITFSHFAFQSLFLFISKLISSPKNSKPRLTAVNRGCTTYKFTALRSNIGVFLIVNIKCDLRTYLSLMLDKALGKLVCAVEHHNVNPVLNTISC